MIAVSSIYPISILKQTDTYICILVKMMGLMREKGLANWMLAICGAVELLCCTFTEGPTISFSSMLVKEVLVESILACTKRSPNYYWVPEENTVEGKFRHTP